MQEMNPQIQTDVESMVSMWRHFKPCALIFVSTCQEDIGTYDLTAASDVGSSETALYNCLLEIGEAGMTFNRLRCVRNERELSSFDECFVTKVSVRAIDSTLTGSPVQDADTLAAIEESLVSPNDAYVQSRFRLGEIGGWQPNFFNLSIKTLGNHTIMNGFQDSNYSVQHAGDLSIGVMLPYVFEPRFPISIGKVPDDAVGYIVVRGSCAQLVEVDSAHVKQPYPLIVEVELLGYTKVMKLSREAAWKLHREVALKLSVAMPLDLARVSFAVNLKENRPLDTEAKNSKSSARGLMQILKGTQCEIETKFMRVKCTPERIYDAKHAIELAQRYLLYQYRRYGGSWRKAVHAYNQGSYNPSRKRAFSDGENYTTNVLSFYNSQDYAALDASIGIQDGGASSTPTTTYSGWS